MGTSGPSGAVTHRRVLNIARQPDNGANPRPDNRSGVLEGATPDVVEEFLDDWTPSGEVDLSVRLWDPSSQLRYRAREKTVPARPDGAPNAWPDAEPASPTAA